MLYDDKIQQIKNIVNKLNEASKLYYNGKESNMTDKEWDYNFDKLKQLEQETGLILNLSPTQNVGYEEVNELEKVKHSKPMLSLDKTKDINDLKKFLGSKKGILSWKEDGLTIVLYYNNGTLVNAITRGDGYVGSKILHNAKVFKNIPKKINYKGKLVIRGEGLISREDFKKININNQYANARNLASGSIMQLNSKTAKQRNLQFKAFSIAECDKDFKYYDKQLKWLTNLGFDVVEYILIDKNNIEECVEIFKTNISNYQFATDGLVLAYNDLEYGKSLGETLHHEKNAMALKWKDDTKETILRDIQFQVGRTGILTPIAIFDNVELEGTTVNKASLHNISILKSLKLGLGDTITVYKANMIIPQIDGNLTKSNTFILPAKCPICNSKLEIQSSEQAKFLYCTNPNCNAKLSQRIKHYCSKSAMNIDGFSIKTIEKFINKGFIKDIIDIYKLEQHKNEIINMSGFGANSYKNLISSIENSKQCELSSFIFALGISNVGISTSKDLVNYFKTLDNLRNATISELLLVKDIGEITANSIYEWFKDENNIKLLDKLLEYVNVIDTDNNDTKLNKQNKNNPLYRKAVYPTGKFKLKKSELKQKLEEVGATVASGYKKSLDYLICGGDTSKSGKIQKAINDGIPLITESEMMKYLK